MLLAQLGSYVPADACALTPMRALFTRMGAADQLCRGRSTFQNELTEAAEALRGLGPRTLLLFDELGRGTSTHDGAAIAHATLDHLAARRGVLCVFVTHHPAVAALATARPAAIRLCHMASIQGGGAPASTVAGAADAADAGALAGLRMQPLYRLAPGAGPGAFALRVSALAGIPTGLLRTAAAQAERLHEQQQRRQHAAQQLRVAAAVVRACVDLACTNVGPEAVRLPVLLRLQEDARVSLEQVLPHRADKVRL